MKKQLISKNSHSQAGFSMLELSIVIFILSTVMTAIAANMGRTVRSLWESRARAYAVNLAQNCIEDFNFANGWMHWSEFYSFEKGGDLQNYCQEMAGLCCTDAQGGNAGLKTICSSATDNGVPVPSCQAGNAVLGELEVSGGDSVDIKALGGQFAKQVERVYYDDKNMTLYNFTIQKYQADISYNQQKYSLGGENKVINNTQSGLAVNNQAVIVIVNVEWEKFGASGASGDLMNRYQVARQYIRK